jgi:hypothetical protein
MTTAARDRDRGGGAVAVPVAVLLLALLAVAGLAVDGVRKAQLLASADAVAEEAARAGGQAVDLVGAQRGVARLDPAAARAAAQQYLDATDTAGTVDVTGDRIHVDVTMSSPTVLLGLMGMDSLTATGSAEVQLVATQSVPGAPR